MNPREALARIPGFAGAEPGIVLSDGVTSLTILVQHLQRRYVLRIDKPAAAELGLDRRAEEEILRLVAAGGLSPEPVYFNDRDGLFMRAFTPGTNWAFSELHNKKSLKRLAGVLRTLHTLPAVKRQFDPLAAVDRYAQQSGTDEAWRLASEALAMHSEIPEPGQLCLCHNDLVHHNILDHDGISLIDWEFAGMGDPMFDIAVLAEHHRIPDRLVDWLLRHYFERPATEAEKEHLLLQRAFYTKLEALWYLRTGTDRRPLEIIMEE
ncbi:MAG: phosphotransferase [Xanthomonadales bacterium]|nr:phosphotransferase [Xanthomonadales bacterium]